MTSTKLSSMVAVSPTERKALFKLAQRASETMKDQWIKDCMAAFGWDELEATMICNDLRRMAKRVLANETTD